jgi:hypothetical protein
MPWERRETHHVASYAFHWFADGDGGWLVAVWGEANAPAAPPEKAIADALTVHHIPARDNPTGSLKPVRAFCERFVSDIPFRVRAIRLRVPAVRRLVDQGALSPPDGGWV